MFNFFKKKIEQKQEDNLASITFFMSKDGEVPGIDIEMHDYSEDSVIAMCLLLNVIVSDHGYLEAIDMIKNGLIKDGKEDILIQILTTIEPSINQKLLDRIEKNKEPCIRPSDML